MLIANGTVLTVTTPIYTHSASRVYYPPTRDISRRSAPGQYAEMLDDLTPQNAVKCETMFGIRA